MPLLESLSDKDAGLKVCNFIKKRLQHRCFPVNIAKCLRTSDGWFISWYLQRIGFIAFSIICSEISGDVCHLAITRKLEFWTIRANYFWWRHWYYLLILNSHSVRDCYFRWRQLAQYYLFDINIYSNPLCKNLNLNQSKFIT